MEQVSNMSAKSQSMTEEEMIPLHLQSYLESHNLEQTVNNIVNQTLKSKPEDPIEYIAQMLQKVAPPTFPAFEKLSARRVHLNDNPNIQSIKLNVYLTYQGQSRLANTVVFAYDEDEKNHFLFSQPETKSGLQASCNMITKTFTAVLRDNLGNEPLTSDALMKMDTILLGFFRQNMAQDSQSQDCLGLNLIRSVSEAITAAVGKILSESQSHPAEIFTNKLNPIPEQKSSSMRFLIPLIQGGKQAGSQVKFSKFYLIIDPSLCTHDSLVQGLKVFQTSLKKAMTGVKGGEAAFKTD
jgi:hypothetical protein